MPHVGHDTNTSYHAFYGRDVPAETRMPRSATMLYQQKRSMYLSKVVVFYRRTFILRILFKSESAEGTVLPHNFSNLL